jgi:hypothetical protein
MNFHQQDPDRSEIAARVGFADPPYPGQSKKHYGDHPGYSVVEQA